MACDPPPAPGPDAGAGPDASSPVSGRVEVRLDLDEEGEIGVGSVALALARLRARTDRGASEDPTWSDVVLELDGDALTAGGVPATYGGALLEPAADEACPARLGLTVREAREVTVCLERWASLDLRCASPSVLAPGGGVRVEVVLHVSTLAPAFEDEELEEGALVDRTTRPALHDALVAAWPAAWSVSCEVSDETSGDRS